MSSIPQDFGRMGHFHDTCAGNEKLAPLVREIGWTFDHLIIEKCKDELECEFYLTHTRTKNCRHWWAEIYWMHNLLIHHIEKETIVESTH